MAGRDEAIDAAARRYGLSGAAAAALWDALDRGGGRQAQFSHPELGGMGQWSGGMVQIGDMFNADLKARVTGACADLAGAMAAARAPAAAPARASVPRAGAAVFDASPVPAAPGDWWPGDLGRPTASGAQNGTRYAVFPGRARLAIEREGRVTLYDTGRHRIGGVSQQQSVGSHLAFTSQDGPVDVERLPVVAP